MSLNLFDVSEQPEQPEPDTIPSLSVVILSKNADNLGPCVRAILDHERVNGAPGVEPGTGGLDIVVVEDEGLDISRYAELAGDNPDEPQFIKLVPGVRPFIFSRNVNRGVQAAGESDTIVCGDDTLLQTHGGFSTMQRIANEWWPQTAILASTCNNVGNVAQHPCPIPNGYAGFRLEDRMVCFVCVMVPRATWEIIGPMDERYVGCGCDDDDTCLIARRAGLGIAITDLCYVDHGSLISSFRGPGGPGGDFRPNLRLFVEKWGVDNRGLTKDQSPWRDLWPK